MSAAVVFNGNSPAIEKMGWTAKAMLLGKKWMRPWTLALIDGE